MDRIDYSFPKEARLTKRKEFQLFSRAEACHAGPLLLVLVRHGQNCRPRLGITASKRFGKAHERNRFKRIIREAFRLCQHQFCPNIELVIKPRSAAKSAQTADVIRELMELVSSGKLGNN